MDIKFSVIIPIYNTERYLEKCIDSVLRQTYENFEIILINDGSTDSSIKICEKYRKKDSRIKVINQNNRGQLVARKNGIKEAKGDYLLFLDSDDFWESNLLEVVNKLAIIYESDLIIFKYQRFLSEKINSDKHVFPLGYEIKPEIIDKKKMLSEVITGFTMNNLTCKAIKRTLILNSDYDLINSVSVKNGEDLLQSLPWLFNAKKIIFFDVPLYNYRIVNNSASNFFHLNLYEDITKVREVVLEYMIIQKMDSIKNLTFFYDFYMKILLKNLYLLSNSRIKQKEKIRILKKLKKEKLFIEGIRYLNYSNLTINHRISYCLLINKQYALVLCFEKVLSYLRTLKGKFSL